LFLKTWVFSSPA